jgi:hypothetical protein
MVKMKLFFSICTLLCTLLVSCAGGSPLPGAKSLNVQYTPASAPWVAELQSCAGDIVIQANQVSADYLHAQDADLTLRIGSPSISSTFSYQVGSEAIVVVVNPSNPLNSLSLDQVRQVFGGQVQNWAEIGGSDHAIQVWTFSSGDDITQEFSKLILGGSPVTSKALLSSSLDEMATEVANDLFAIGFLPKSSVTNTLSEAYLTDLIPVVAQTPIEVTQEVINILACLQK